jgi:hypothetical protein
MVDTFGVQPQLVEAHDGIFEILLGSEVIYTNQSACRRVPTIPEALESVARRLEPLPEKAHRAANPFIVI